MAEPKERFQCQVNNCGYIFDPDKGVKKKTAASTAFKELQDGWACPRCGATPKPFRALTGTVSVIEDGV